MTKEALFELTAVRFEWVEVEGFGKVGIRGQTESKRSQRIAEMFGPDGNPVRDASARQRLGMLIDQLMTDENTPMFTEADRKALSEQDGSALDPLITAIHEFNGVEEEKNELGGSAESSDD